MSYLVYVPKCIQLIIIISADTSNTSYVSQVKTLACEDLL